MIMWIRKRSCSLQAKATSVSSPSTNCSWLLGTSHQSDFLHGRFRWQASKKQQGLTDKDLEMMMALGSETVVHAREEAGAI